jgi:hypothetical protein
MEMPANSWREEPKGTFSPPEADAEEMMPLPVKRGEVEPGSTFYLK